MPKTTEKEVIAKYEASKNRPQTTPRPTGYQGADSYRSPVGQMEFNPSKEEKWLYSGNLNDFAAKQMFLKRPDGSMDYDDIESFLLKYPGLGDSGDISYSMLSNLDYRKEHISRETWKAIWDYDRMALKYFQPLIPGPVAVAQNSLAERMKTVAAQEREAKARKEGGLTLIEGEAPTPLVGLAGETPTPQSTTDKSIRVGKPKTELFPGAETLETEVVQPH